MHFRRSRKLNELKQRLNFKKRRAQEDLAGVQGNSPESSPPRPRKHGPGGDRHGDDLRGEAHPPEGLPAVGATGRRSATWREGRRWCGDVARAEGWPEGLETWLVSFTGGRGMLAWSRTRWWRPEWWSSSARWREKRPATHGGLKSGKKGHGSARDLSGKVRGGRW